MPPRNTPAPAVALLVRHGRTATTGKVLPGRAPGLHLSDHGQRQATELAKAVAAMERKPVAVYASPLERAVETAKPIASALGCRVRTERGLLECDFGEWTGSRLSLLRRRRQWRLVQNQPSTFRFPGGESFAEMQVRVVDTLDRLAAVHAGESFVAVSHADPIKAAVAATAGTPLDLFQRLTISPCSLTVLMRGEGVLHVLAVNTMTWPGELVLS